MTLPLLSSSAWLVVTRLGEAQILLPAVLATLAWIARRAGAGRPALVWLLAVGGAAVLTTITKVAFLGWGVGIAPLDFTGISGHAMFAAAVWPVLVAALAGDRPRWRGLAIGAGYALALLIGVSRVVVQAHSVSEVVAGFALGSLASALALTAPGAVRLQAPTALALGLAVWLIGAPAKAPPSPTHGWVIRLSLALSGRSEPYTRQMLHQPALRTTDAGLRRLH